MIRGHNATLVAARVLACSCGQRSITLALVDDYSIPPRRSAVVRCACGRLLLQLTPRMVAAFAASDGRIVRPTCGTTARCMRERGLLGDSIIATDFGVAIGELVREQIAEQRAANGDDDHVW